MLLNALYGSKNIKIKLSVLVPLWLELNSKLTLRQVRPARLRVNNSKLIIK